MAITTVTMTGAEFDALPCEEGLKYELLDGELIPASSATPFHHDIVGALYTALRAYIRGKNTTGRVYSDVEFALGPKNRVRPDLCVLLDRKARDLDRTVIPIPGAPDIAVEVISPTERASTMHDKVIAYLRSGVQEVWQVYPNSRTLQIYRGDTARSLDENAVITTPLLPDFSIRVADLFE